MFSAILNEIRNIEFRWNPKSEWQIIFSLKIKRRKKKTIKFCSHFQKDTILTQRVERFNTEKFCNVCCTTGTSKPVFSWGWSMKILCNWNNLKFMSTDNLLARSISICPDKTMCAKSFNFDTFWLENCHIKLILS